MSSPFENPLKKQQTKNQSKNPKWPLKSKQQNWSLNQWNMIEKFLMTTSLASYRITDLNENDIQTTNFDEVVDTFDEMGLKPELLRGIFGYG